MLGFSLVSFIEILYWLTGRLARNCLGKSSDSDEGLTVAELGNARKVRKAEVGLAKVLEAFQQVTTGSAAKYSIPSAPSNLYNGEADIEDEDHYYRYRKEKSKDNLTEQQISLAASHFPLWH